MARIKFRQSCRLGLFLLMTLVLSLRPLPVHAATLTVTILDDTNDGICDTHCSLREAIATASAGAFINFAVSGTITLESELVIDKSLTIAGPGATSLTISGNASVRTLTVAADVMLILQDLTVANGFATNIGGGIRNMGTLTISNSTFAGNRADNGGGISNVGTLVVSNSTFASNSASSGGGIFNIGRLTMTDSTFTDNSADFIGGGIVNSGILTVSNSTFSRNHSGPEGEGGGIWNTSTLIIRKSSFFHNSSSTGSCIANNRRLTVSESTFSYNQASLRFNHEGGCIYNGELGMLTTTDSTFADNNTRGVGGGIRNDGTLTVTASIFISNTALGGGGIRNDGTLTVSNSTFVRNHASGGGGIDNHGTLTVSNSTFSGNEANGGGGIDNYGPLMVINSTFAHNRAARSGGGIANIEDTTTLRNTIVVLSISGGNCAGLITDGGHNLQFPGTDCGESIPAGDPLLGLLADTGRTLIHSLPSDSPALDAGDNAVCAAPPVNNQDQRGQPRPVDGDNDGSAICDIGAYELQVAPTGPITLVPATATNQAGQAHTVTATVTDDLGNPQPGLAVTFTVLSGPNVGAEGVCTPNTDCTSDATGAVSFTYTGSGGAGTDEIQACLLDPQGTEICSPIVTKVWTTDDTAPTCSLPVFIPGPPRGVRVTVQDTDSGLAQINVVTATNADVNIPPFSVGSTDPVVVSGTRIDSNERAQVVIEVIDVAGNSVRCDPILTTITTGYSLHLPILQR